MEIKLSRKLIFRIYLFFFYYFKEINYIDLLKLSNISKN
jgi:hypothetical protein